MRVLWLVRADLERHSGGDTTQILQTQAALERRGVRVERRTRIASPADLAGFDLLHLFHFDRLWEHMRPCRLAQRARVPIALSTIYWPADEFDRHARAGWQGQLARLAGSDVYRTARIMQKFGLHALGGGLADFDARLFSFRAAARRLLDSTTVLLPNSRAEYEQIQREFGRVPTGVIVPNAVDTDVFGAASSPEPQSRAGILYVGRIEPRKNQLALIQALSGTPHQLTLVGKAGRLSRDYERACRRAAGDNVRFLAARSAAELATLYRAAAVHACVSWYETPGLASLEAAACGCRLVVTPGGCTREYFGDHAQYANPGDPATIRAAIERALVQPASDELIQRVRRDWTWDAAAEATLRGYEKALANRASHVS